MPGYLDSPMVETTNVERSIWTNSTTTNTVWTLWAGQTTGTAITTGGIWPLWCQGTTTATTMSNIITGSAAWTIWCDEAEAHITRRPQRYVPPPPTAEQVETQRLARAAETERYMEAQRLRVAAEARAETLLIENLSLAQRLQYAETKAFVVEGRGGRRFRIRNGRSGNVDVVGRDGRVLHRLCAHPRELVPNCDTMLAQKLMLEDDEATFLRVANQHTAFDAAPVLEALH